MSLKDDNNSFEPFVVWWNSKFPLDRWWRNKYKIAFNSSAHRTQSPIDIWLEFVEEQLFVRFHNQRKQKEIDAYQPGRGDWLRAPSYKLTDEEIEDIYTKVDINKIEKDGSILIEE